MRKTLMFTLIELLVVIAIIAILAAMLMPALERARESSMRAVCLNNMRQWHLGLEMFADAHDGYYPGIVESSWGAWGLSSYRRSGEEWMSPYSVPLPDYVTKEITLCPSSPEAPWDNTGQTGQSAQKDHRAEWQYYEDPELVTGLTDYIIRVGFGSAHTGIGDSYYEATAGGSWRGFHSGAMPSELRTSGFGFKYRRNQRSDSVSGFTDGPIHSKNILLMDRQLCGDKIAGGYNFIRANHTLGDGRVAEGSNILQRAGNARWMDLTGVWSRDNWSENYFGKQKYNDRPNFYVDDDIAQHLDW